jgi:hypothetical protein
MFCLAKPIKKLAEKEYTIAFFGYIESLNNKLKSA